MGDLLPVGTKYVSHKDGKSFVGDGIARFPEPAEEDRFYTKNYCYRFVENIIGCFGWSVKVTKRIVASKN